MFQVFQNQNDRRNFGGSAFLEFQYCKMKFVSKIEDLVSVDNVEFWKDNSLYVYIDDIELFLEQYAKFFDGGTYNNLETGMVDMYGINYYFPNQVEEIIRGIEMKKPKEYGVILEWLNRAKDYDGIYILGI